MKFSRNKKIVLVVLFAIAAVFVANLSLAREGDVNDTLSKEEAQSLSTYAQGTAAKPVPQSGGDATIVQPTGQPLPETIKGFGGVLGVIGKILGSLLALIAWLITFAVNLGNDVIDMGIVRLGWQIVLSFTNLGFVLAIIIIAFATIFRLESYALKQTLWKLIVAALLVNFSLVIAGAFINVSNSTTKIFLKATTADNLGNALGQAMQPQQFVMTTGSESWLSKGITEWVTNPFSKMLQIVAGFVFALIFTFLTVLIFFALFLMLLIRAIALIFLLILSPLAWLFWIFPYTQQYWKKWWTEFLRWNFFAPVVLFFVYLTVATAAGMDQIKSVLGAKTDIAAQTFEATTLVGSGFAGQAARLFIILGMLFGGLYVANQFGIAGAGLAYGWATGVGKMFGGWVGRKGVQLGTAPVRWAPVRKGLEKIENLAAGKRWADFATLGGTALARHGAARLSRLGGIGAERAVEEAKKRLPADDYRLAKMIHTLDAPAQVAALQRLRQNKTLDLIDDITPFISDEMREKFVKYGQPSPDYSALLRTAGLNPEMLKIMKAKAGGQKGFIRKVRQPDGTTKDVSYGDIDKAMEDASVDFAKDFRPEHWSNTEVDEIFGKKEEFGLGNIKFEDGTSAHRYRAKNLARGILETNPDGIANAFRRIKGGNRIEFMNDLSGQLEKIMKEKRKDAQGKEYTHQEKYNGDMWTMLEKEYPSVYRFLLSPTAASLGIAIPGLEGGEERRSRGRRSGVQDPGTWV